MNTHTLFLDSGFLVLPCLVADQALIVFLIDWLNLWMLQLVLLVLLLLNSGFASKIVAWGNTRIVFLGLIYSVFNTQAPHTPQEISWSCPSGPTDLLSSIFEFCPWGIEDMSKYAFVFNMPLACESFVCPLSPQAGQNKILRGRALSNSLLEDGFLDSCQRPLSTGFLDAFSIWLSKHLAATLFPNILTSCGICGGYSYFQGGKWPVNLIKSYISILSLLGRVPPPPGGLGCEIGVIIITEMLAVQWFPERFALFLAGRGVRGVVGVVGGDVWDFGGL